MIRRDGEHKQRTFSDEARAMAAVPHEHLLLRMRRVIDWAAVEKELEDYYDRWVGRPSWPPALLVRMLLLEQYGGLSDRQVAEQVGCNLLYRAFVGLGIDEAVPDDTTLVKFRERLGEEGVRKIFELANGQWAAAGLMGEERRVLDGVHMWAKVAHRSLAALMRKGREVIIEAVGEIDKGRGEKLREQYLGTAERLGVPMTEAAEAEGERTKGLVEAVRELSDEKVRSRVAQVQTLLSGEADLYYFSVHDCGACPLQDTCLSPGEREGKTPKRRRVYLSDVRKGRVVAGEAGRQWRKEQLRVRGRIEAKFSEQMNRHGLRHARYWGLSKVTMQVVLNVITVNAKRVVKLLQQAAAAGPPTRISEAMEAMS